MFEQCVGIRVSELCLIMMDIIEERDYSCNHPWVNLTMMNVKKN